MADEMGDALVDVAVAEPVPAVPSPAVAAPAVAAPERAGMLEPLRHRDFRLVFSGETISLLGDQFHFIALAWLVLQLTGSGVALGTVLMVAAVPRGVFMLVGGALSDRWSPRSLMLWSNAIRGLVVGIVAGLVLSGRAELWHLYVLALIFGTVDALFYPAINTIVPMLVGERLLPPANALMQSVQQLAGLIGPAAAGVLVAAVSTGPAFVVDAVSFGVAASAIALVAGGRRTKKGPDDEPAAPAEPLLRTIGSGIRYAWADPAVRALILISAAVNLGFTGPISVGLPYMAETRFGGPVAYGLMGSFFAVGALTGALAAGAIRRVPRLGLVSLVVVAGLGVCQALLGSVPNLPSALVIGVVIGLGVGFVNVRLVAWLQVRTPEAYRGRVMSLLMLASVGAAPVSLAVAGFVIDFGALPLLFALAGALIAASAVAGFAFGLQHRMIDASEAAA
jgi:MFS family permease